MSDSLFGQDIDENNSITGRTQFLDSQISEENIEIAIGGHP